MKSDIAALHKKLPSKHEFHVLFKGVNTFQTILSVFLDQLDGIFTYSSKLCRWAILIFRKHCFSESKAKGKVSPLQAYVAQRGPGG